jgi:hypothetical protein
MVLARMVTLLKGGVVHRRSHNSGSNGEQKRFEMLSGRRGAVFAS